MENVPQITSLLALTAYLLATWVLLRTRQHHDAASPGVVVFRHLPRLFHLFTFTAMTLHTISIYTVVVTDSGLLIGFFPALSVTSLLVVALLTAISIWQPLAILGVVLLPVAGLCTFAGSWITSSTAVTEMALQWHILASVMAYGMLVLAATQSVALAIQTHYLRTLRPAGILGALPPIDLMEKLLFQMIGAGFVLLSVSLLTGALFLQDIFAQHLVHKTTLSIMAWLVFGILLTGRLVRGWRGKTALVWTLSGLGLLIVGYFGSKLVLEFILVR